MCLTIRNPDRICGAILHEPAFHGVFGDPDAVRAPLRALVGEAMAAGGPPAAIERFWCYVAGNDGWAKLPSELRERMQSTAGTLLGIELGSYERYLPEDETLAAIAAPVQILVSSDSLPFFAEMAHGIGERLGADLVTTPGTHAAYHDHPRELAETIRPFLREVCARGG